MLVAGSTRRPGLWTLPLLWGGVLASLGCSEVTDLLDARALRRHFPEQADAILQSSFPFTAAADGFEAVRPQGALAELPGDAALRPRFPRDGGGALRFPLPDGSVALVRELGAAGEAAAEENAIAYPRTGGTSFWTALEDGYEEWLLLEPGAVRRDAPVATWQVDGAALRQRGDAVELADARGIPQLRVTAPEAYAAGQRPVGTRLVARGERLELWVEAEGEAVLVDPRWKLKQKMHESREGPTATALRDGRVLVAGGDGKDFRGLRSAEMFDPNTGTWLAVEPMLSARSTHTATLLRDGRVLIAGGYDFGTTLDSAEIFDPDSGKWTAVEPMISARFAHKTAPLPGGRVLVVGGSSPEGGEDGTINSAEIFDPDSGKWTAVDPMISDRCRHDAAPLPGGKVLVAGGYAMGEELDSAEVFDPDTGKWTAVEPMTSARQALTATPLPDGRVLVVGGRIEGAEVFDPGTGTWLAVEPMRFPRSSHTATTLRDGRVLVAGGVGIEGLRDRAEVFDPVTGTWLFSEPMLFGRSNHAAALLPDGRVLVAGGGALDSAEVFDPASDTWLPLGTMPTGRIGHTATALPDGRMLVVGGARTGALESVEVFDPVTETWRSGAPLITSRADHTATTLPDGRLVVAGGSGGGEHLDSAEVLDPASGMWRPLGRMSSPRNDHAAALMPDGRVLVTGGNNLDVDVFHLDSAEVLDPASGTWSPVGDMHDGRAHHTATALPDGRVLVAGGSGIGGALESAEVLDPASGMWFPVAPMFAARYGHTATVLLDGRVLVAGGDSIEGVLESAEVFDPASGLWFAVEPMSAARVEHSATLLPGGQVLVAGGSDLSAGIFRLDSVEMFDPATGRWLQLGPLHTARNLHTAALLADGQVVLTGGFDGEDRDDSVEVFRPMPTSSICKAAVECQSGFCSDSVCCDQACNVYVCESCSDHRGASADGVCTSLHPDYPPFACSPRTGQQTKPCGSVHDCVEGYVCDASGDCVPPPPNGGYLHNGACHLATPAAAQPAARGPLELGLLALAAACSALRRPRGGRRDRA
ncbi:kelch repeat-containing protein [Sorangium sp. So ce321]|uniref:Kelch repeat-containing protein n=1 Tax=Sorangium sp. So ce321 TaxID=3133300 RepID=UPI003F5DC465